MDDFQSPREKALNNQINLFSFCTSHRLRWYGQSPNQRQGRRQDRGCGTRIGKHRDRSQGRQATIKKGAVTSTTPQRFLVDPYDKIMRIILIQAKKRNIRTTHSMILKIMREELPPVVRQSLWNQPCLSPWLSNLRQRPSCPKTSNRQSPRRSLGTLPT